MSVTTRQTVLIKGEVDEGIKECRAAEANLIPGYLLQIDTNGAVVTNNDSVKRAEVLVALEDDFRGMNIDGQSPDASTTGYQIGEVVRCRVCERGDVLNMILVSGEHATPDEYLTSNADGKLKVAGATDYRMFKCVEESDATAADKRVLAEVM